MEKDLSTNVESTANQADLPRILLVEDEIVVAMDLQHRLEMLGFQVAALATRGEEAIQFAASESPDMILMDIKLRGSLDGIDTAVKIREKHDIPIIYLTAFADEATLKRARITEAYGYLIKPFEERELKSMIEMALYKHQIERKLRESEQRYALVVRAANDGIWDWDLRLDEITYSERWAQMLGLDPVGVGKDPGEWLDRVHPENQRGLMQSLSAHLLGTTPAFECEYRIRHEDGAYRWMLCRGMALFDDQQKPYRIAGSQSDITDRKRFEVELLHRALHDELTGLPNRALFVDRMKVVQEQMKRIYEKDSAILFLDIDNFKFVNDSFGHAWGDKLLIQIARRLEFSLRPGDTVARFGGDEFAILLEHVDNPGLVQQIARRIQAEFEKPFRVMEEDVFVTASIGIMYFNIAQQSTEEILRDADIAMYSAKNKGGACHVIFNVQMREHTLQRMDREIELRQALDRREFVLHYQPIFTIADRKLSGYEALIRWQHPARGLIYPDDFISIAEETRLIVPIGDWVIRTACAQAQEWNTAGSSAVKVSVNISRVQLLDEDFIPKFQDALRQSGVDPRLLEMEITESLAMENVELTIQRLAQLQQLGVNVALDDFGCGYSSLDYLRHLPANTLKIDRSFIKDMKEDNLAIVAAMIKMAHQLRMKVVGEGVEDENQLAILADLDCDEVQGYYFGKAASPQEIRLSHENQ